MFKILNILSLLFLVGNVNFAQSSSEGGRSIPLYNASFEGLPTCCRPPFGWEDCGFPNETPPDIQPSNAFDVTRPSYHGRTYLGMVVRDNDTWERVSQRLIAPMEANVCYEFSLFLCRSPIYLSPTHRDSTRKVPFVKPVKIRIWGGNNYCDRAQVLAESPLVKNTDWQKYNFKLEPQKRFAFIMIEAFYKTPVLLPYNGNVLIDNASNLVPVPCDKEIEPIVEPDRVVVDKVINQKPPVVANTPPKTKPPSTPSAKPKVQSPPKKNPDPQKSQKPNIKILSELSRDIKVGQTIRIRNLYFEADTSNIDEGSFDVLDEIYHFLAYNENVIVEIGGHTNGVCQEDYCNRLSIARAKAVADYLTESGISNQRVKYKGYGKTKPIASNRTPYGRQKNQRVEIKILSVI